MKKSTIFVIIAFLAVLGWAVSMSGGSLTSLAALECCTLNLQQEPPSDWQKTATSPETGIPATARPSTTGENMKTITDPFKPFTEPFILLP